MIIVNNVTIIVISLFLSTWIITIISTLYRSSLSLFRSSHEPDQDQYLCCQYLFYVFMNEAQECKRNGHLSAFLLSLPRHSRSTTEFFSKQRISNPSSSSHSPPSVHLSSSSSFCFVFLVRPLFSPCPPPPPYLLPSPPLYLLSSPSPYLLPLTVSSILFLLLLISYLLPSPLPYVLSLTVSSSSL